MTEQDRWEKLEEIVRRVVREEIAALGKKPKINLVNGKWTGITQDTLEAWQAAYPGVDIEAEVRKAAAWCLSNPTSAPTSQYGRYLNSWLGRQQNQVSLRSIPTARQLQSPPNLCEYCMREATGAVSGRRHCRDHMQDAMDGPPRKMHGVVPKAVAGD